MKLVSIPINKVVRPISKDFWFGWTPTSFSREKFKVRALLWCIVDDFSILPAIVLNNYLR